MSVYEFGPFRLNAEQLLLTHGAKAVALGPKVVETLLALVEQAGEVVTKPDLIARVWPEGFIDEASLAQNVHVLRKTFRQYGSADPIETVPRRGYRFTSAVRDAGGSHGAAPVRTPPLTRLITAAVVGAAFIAASLLLFAGHGLGRHLDAPPTRHEANEKLYQIGRYYWNLRTRDGVRRSLHYFEQVVDADPLSARGFAAVADANVAIGDYCYGTKQPAVYFARARAYAEKALALDPNSAEAHATLGFLALDRDEVTLANAELQRAIALAPSYAPAHAWYGIGLVAHGRIAEGLQHLKLAGRQDPLAVTTTAWLAAGAYAARRFDDAIVYAQQALELSPRRADALMTLGESYEAQGRIASAIATFKRYADLDPYYRPEGSALLARAYALALRRNEARAHFAYARAHAGEVYAVDLATAAAALGDPSLAALRRVRSHRMGTENAARVYFATRVTTQLHVSTE